MTRAKERLAFSRTPPWHAGPERSWWHRIEAMAIEWRPALLAAPQGTLRSTAVVDLPLASRARPILAAAAGAADGAAARLGQAVHRVLEWATASAGPM